MTPLSAALAAPPVLKENAPDRYVVVEGDTLWSIAGRFLQNPWQWPEIWKMNHDQIKNPNRIYPGDVIVVDRTAQETRLRLLKLETVTLQPQVRVEQLKAKPVPTIPGVVIEPFLARPMIVGPTELDSAPFILASQDHRVTIGAGATAYASGLTKEQGRSWQLFRRGDPLVDPDTNETLGYEAVYLGEAQVTQFGTLSTVHITRSTREILAGDRLIASGKEIPNFGYVPHAPANPIKGRIVSSYGSLGDAGPLSIVTLSKGSRDGLEVGHVLAIYRSQTAARFQQRTAPLYGREGPSGNDAPRTYYSEQLTPRDGPLYPRGFPVTDELIASLPDERYGLAMVFRTFDRASFAIIMQASRQVSVNDVVTNP
ncbi:MAG: LysM peptidoglycan-binding domain-containing protein [Burkholderiales bacterium]|nr:LysM peptidoglycan-binding domain-containing protein [Burkholderiales bacterium]